MKKSRPSEGAFTGLSSSLEYVHSRYEREGVQMTKDTTPVEPKVLEFKFYARGVGPVLEVTASGGSDRDELVSFHPGK
jgi:hypothetical protein